MTTRSAHTAGLARAVSQKIILTVKVTPKSGRGEISKVLADGTLKIKLKSAPERGKANQELIRLLSDHFRVPQKNIRIIKGATSAFKKIEIS